MENGFKMRISRIFRSSLGSCRSKDITDVIQTSSPPIFLPDNHRRYHHRHHQLMDLFSPKPPPPQLPFSSLRRKPKSSKCPQTQNRGSPLLLTDAEGQKCPPATPISPFLDTFHDDHHGRYFQSGAASSSSKGKEKTKKTKKPKRVRSRIKTFGLHDEFPACSYNGLFSSDEDDDDKTTLFSSRSLSSDSSESLPRSQSCRMVERTNREKIRSGVNKVKDDSEITAAAGKGISTEGKVKDSFAVVKRSSDPYNDFRTSMVEMIVERQIYSGDELEELLQCFLSLNSYQHHGVIVEVFSEIWAALFSKSTHR